MGFYGEMWRRRASVLRAGVPASSDHVGEDLMGWRMHTIAGGAQGAAVGDVRVGLDDSIGGAGRKIKN